MRNNDRDKLEIFDSKLSVGSPADLWYSNIPIKIRKRWRMVRELFVLMWVEKVQQEAIGAKVKLFLHELESTRPSRAPQDILFVEPLPPSCDVVPVTISLPYSLSSFYSYLHRWNPLFYIYLVPI